MIIYRDNEQIFEHSGAPWDENIIWQHESDQGMQTGSVFIGTYRFVTTQLQEELL